MIITDEYKAKLSGIESGLSNLYEALKLDDIKAQLAKDEELSATDGFWNDMELSQKISQSIKNAKNMIAEFDALKTQYEDLVTLIELAEDGGLEDVEEDIVSGFPAFEADLEKAKLKTLLSGEYDKNNAILTFHAGAGGTEAQDWAEMLYRMYTRFAQRHDYKITVLDYLDGDDAGLKSASILVEGMYAYGYLKGENGVHRLVRVSPFDSSGRRHTSFASLEVMPELN
ncbi:MAG: PCRF domain-containing protein, partial [Clostridia bacterium]|nr:PCRF domain-containing protein [Clostridia bacterium]